MFKDNYYICIQDHHLKMQSFLNERLKALATLQEVKVCASNEVRYLYPQDAIAVDLMKASIHGEKIDRNYKVQTNQMYLKDAYEMSLLFDREIIENTNDLASLINITFNENSSFSKEENPNALLKKDTTKILEITYFGENKDNIKNKLEKIKEFIMVRHQKLSNFYDIAVQTEQIGDIKISEEAINEPKTALIVTVAFITGFILSIFLVFFIQFIQSIKKES